MAALMVCFIADTLCVLKNGEFLLTYNIRRTCPPFSEFCGSRTHGQTTRSLLEFLSDVIHNSLAFANINDTSDGIYI